MRRAAKRYGQDVASHHLRPLLLIDRIAENAGHQARMGFSNGYGHQGPPTGLGHSFRAVYVL